MLMTIGCLYSLVPNNGTLLDTIITTMVSWFHYHYGVMGYDICT